MKPSFWPIIVLIFRENSNLVDLGAAEVEKGNKAAPAAVPVENKSSLRLIFVIIGLAKFSSKNRDIFFNFDHLFILIHICFGTN
jgi:hypothetical protein